MRIFPKKGTEHNYAIFTSALDDSVGMDTDGIGTTGYPNEADPGYNDYLYALNAVNAAYAKIDYAKFRYAGWAGSFYNMDEEVTVSNSIVRNCNSGFSVFGSCPEKTFENNLFVDLGPSGSTYYGLAFLARVPESGDIYVLSNTFDNICGNGVKFFIGSPGPNQNYYIKNNIFSNLGTAINNPYTSGKIRNNGFYQVTSRGRTDPGDTPIPTAIFDPYVSNDVGSYFLNQACVFIDTATDTAENLGLHEKTTCAVEVSRTVINDISESTTWSKIDRDTGTGDLGYHYVPVDYVIKGPLRQEFQGDYPGIFVENVETTLVINPGVTIAFSDDITNGSGDYCAYNQAIYAIDGGSIRAVGDAYNPIVFTSVITSGDRLGNDAFRDPAETGSTVYGKNMLYSRAIWNYSDAGDKTMIEMCDFYNGWNGLVIEKAPQTFIRSCRFYGATGSGVFIYNPINNNDHMVAIMNNLFVNCVYGLHVYINYSNEEFKFINNTVDGGYNSGQSIEIGEHGILLDELNQRFGDSGGEILNNIFVNQSGYGIYNDDPVGGGGPPTNPLATQNNCYRNCNDGNFYYVAQLNVITEYPDLVENPDDDSLFERYYLDQDNSPCVDAGHPDVLAYKTTDIQKNDPEMLERDFLDYYSVDVGYHYPVKGYVQVSSLGRYFEYEDGTPFIPIGSNEGMSWTDAFRETLYRDKSWENYVGDEPEKTEAYFVFLKQHGVNSIRIFGENAYHTKDSPTFYEPNLYEVYNAAPGASIVVNPFCKNFFGRSLIVKRDRLITILIMAIFLLILTMNIIIT